MYASACTLHYTCMCAGAWPHAAACLAWLAAAAADWPAVRARASSKQPRSSIHVILHHVLCSSHPFVPLDRIGQRPALGRKAHHAFTFDSLAKPTFGLVKTRAWARRYGNARANPSPTHVVRREEMSHQLRLRHVRWASVLARAAGAGAALACASAVRRPPGLGAQVPHSLLVALGDSRLEACPACVKHEPTHASEDTVRQERVRGATTQTLL